MKYEYTYCFICAKRCGSYYYDCSPMTFKSPGRHGSGKLISTFDARKFRTWKYTRKTQWKQILLKRFGTLKKSTYLCKTNKN